MTHPDSITAIEAALEQAGVPFRRTFDWHAGWAFEVRGEVVARGDAIGLLEREVRRWWDQTAGHR